jgi:hypothetical protein
MDRRREGTALGLSLIHAYQESTHACEDLMVRVVRRCRSVVASTASSRAHHLTGSPRRGAEFGKILNGKPFHLSDRSLAVPEAKKGLSAV